MDLAQEETFSRLRLCRIGLQLTALALGLLCLSDLIHIDPFIAVQFGWRGLGLFRFAQNLESQPVWYWGVGLTIPVTSLIGSFYFWGRWPEPSWQLRARALIVLNTIDMGSWLITNSHEMGLTEFPFRHEWLVHLITLGAGWVELAITASLAEQIGRGLGEPRPDRTDPQGEPEEDGDAGRSGSVMTLTTIGLMIWALMVFTQTQWTWPLAMRPPHNPRVPVNVTCWLMDIASIAIQLILTFQVTLMCLTVSRRCQRYVAEKRAEIEQHDLLVSRSESEIDETFWK